MIPSLCFIMDLMTCPYLPVLHALMWCHYLHALGVEVKGGESLKVKPEEDLVIHISQAALGESKKDKANEPVPVFVKVGNKKLVLGNLSSQKIPQLSLDLVFEKEFELSHNWKNGSIYFCGYQTHVPDEDEGVSDFDESEDEDQELPLVIPDNGKVEPKAENAKSATTKATTGKFESSAKPNAKLVEPSKDNKPGDESDKSDDGESDDGDGSEEEEGESEEGVSIDEDEDDDDDDDEEDEETPKKAKSGKKRPNDSVRKTSVHSKKAKAATPQKTGGQKGGYTATPHPAKNAGKTAANAKPHTPKSYAAVKSHTKARNK